LFFVKIVLTAGLRWLTPVILVTWEAEIGRIVIGAQPGQIVHETLSPKKKEEQNKNS
jgi:hypothetical protein